MSNQLFLSAVIVHSSQDNVTQSRQDPEATRETPGVKCILFQSSPAMTKVSPTPFKRQCYLIIVSLLSSLATRF